MNSEKKSYVVGFMFSHNYREVVLIEKSKPAWQAGKLNGVGGKIEEGETPLQAMVREFREETGYDTESRGWKQYAKLHDDLDTGVFEVYFFYTTGDAERCKTTTPERICRASIEAIRQPEQYRLALLPNIPWLVEMALSIIAGGEHCRMFDIRED